MKEQQERDAFRRAVDTIELNDERKERMLRQIRSRADRSERRSHMWRYAAASVAALLVTAVVALALLPGSVSLPVATPDVSAHSTAPGMSDTTAPVQSNASSAEAPGSSAATTTRATAATTAVTTKAAWHTSVTTRQANGTTAEAGAIIKRAENEFMFDGRLYERITDYQREAYDLPAEVPESEAGEPLGVIEESVDKTLIGCPVYRYDDFYGEWVYTAKRAGKVEVYLFAGFHSSFDPAPYEDPDRGAAEFLRIFGVDSAAAIDRIELWDSPEGVYVWQATYREREAIEAFYEAFRVLFSDKKGAEETMMSVGKLYAAQEETTVASSTYPTNVKPAHKGYAHYAYEGGVEIRICLKNGYTMNQSYYPRMHYLGGYPLDAQQDAFFRDFCQIT